MRKILLDKKQMITFSLSVSFFLSSFFPQLCINALTLMHMKHLDLNFLRFLSHFVKVSQSSPLSHEYSFNRRLLEIICLTLKYLL